MLDHALALAAQGWRVFPCSPQHKGPLLKIRERARPAIEFVGPLPADDGWKTQATTDAAMIRHWWSSWPSALIGVPQGLNTGALVVDLDVGLNKKTGITHTRESLRTQLQAFLGIELPSTWAALTASGGEHVYFGLPKTESGRPMIFGNGRGALPSKDELPVDIRGEGGYVIVPPSVRADGKAYSWLAAPEFIALAVLPQPLIDCLLRQGAFEEAKARSPAPIERARERAGDSAAERYAERALQAELKHLAGSIGGTRNDDLFHGALRMGQLVAAGVLEENEVLSALESVAANWPSFKKSQGTIKQGFARGLREPRDLSEVGRSAAVASASPFAPLPAGEGDYGILRNTSHQVSSEAPQSGPRAAGRAPKTDERRLRDEEDRQRTRDPICAFRPLTDLGNAERFADRFRGRLLYCPALKWLWWDGRRWAREGAEERVQEAEHYTVRAIADEAEWLRKSDRDLVIGEKKVAKGEPPETLMLSDLLDAWARASEENRKLSPIAKRARSKMDVPEKRLDADPFKINCRNGTLVVRCGLKLGDDPISFKDHDPDDLITMIMPIDYDPEATCDRYDRFLAQMQPSAAVRRFLHQWGGLGLTGDVTEQRFVFFWGGGNNGKSTLLEAWGALTGDYGKAVPVETFLGNAKSQKSGSSASPDLAMLRGRRFVHTNEPEKGARISEGLIKLVTGGDEVPVRDLYGGFFDLRPQFKLTMSGNFKPKIDGGDATSGIWRRIVMVVWGIKIAKEALDRNLPMKLRQELPGILNRLLDGLRDWLDTGLLLPEDVTAATEKFRQDSDPLGRFLAAATVSEAGAREQSSKVYAVYEAWCKANGEHAWKQNGFSRAMGERYESLHSNVNYYLGLRLVKSVGDYVDHQGNAHGSGPQMVGVASAGDGNDDEFEG